jgi:putative ABC transport system permease protein
LTAGGVASAVVLTVFLVGVYRGAERGSLSYVAGTGADVWIGREGTWNLMRSSGLLPGAAVQAVESLAGVRHVESLLAALLPAYLKGQERTLLVIGLTSDSRLAAPSDLAAGRSLPGPGEVIVDHAFAQRSRITVGDTLSLAQRVFRVVGISRQTNLLVTQYAFLPADDLRAILGLTDQSTFLLVKTDPGQNSAVTRRVNSQLPGIAAFERSEFLANNRREIASGFLPVLWTIAVLGLVAGCVVVGLTIYAAVLEKRKDYALLAALGSSARTRMGVVIQQAVAAAVMGGFAGLWILTACEKLLPHLVPEVEFQLEIPLAVFSLLGAVAMACAAAIPSARLAGRIPPTEAFKR